jgi:hypothetical protein
MKLGALKRRTLRLPFDVASAVAAGFHLRMKLRRTGWRDKQDLQQAQGKKAEGRQALNLAKI